MCLMVQFVRRTKSYSFQIPHCTFFIQPRAKTFLRDCTTYSADPRQYHPPTLFPPQKETLPPLIHHIKSKYGGRNIEEVILGETKLSKSYVRELLHFGAVYLSVPDKRSKLSRPEGSSGRRDEGMSKCERFEPSTLTLQAAVPPGSYIRVHVNPRRYPLVYSIPDWKTRILNVHLDQDMIFVDKPVGVPTVAGVDNKVENLQYQIQSLFPQCRLHVLGRLDACSSGVVAFAASVSSASSASAGKKHQMVAQRRVRKMYKALSTKRPTLGKHKHLFRRKRDSHENAKPTLLRSFDPTQITTQGSEWQLAELDIVDCQAISQSNLNIPWIKKILPSFTEDQVLYESIIELHTGRTHQIRLQFSALGCALVGDTRYTPTEGLLDEEGGHGDGTDKFGPDPQYVGLQCYQLSYECHTDSGDAISSTAGMPWWRDKSADIMC